MKRLYNILVPKFLRDFDVYLLRNYPVVWRTKAVWVLFYGVIATILLFGAGFWYAGYTVSQVIKLETLTVAPVEEIRMGYDSYHLYSVGLVLIGIVYWAYRQYLTGFSFTKAKDVLLTLFLYSLCFWCIFSIVTPAFRLGTIYKTAYHWMGDNDIDSLQKSGIYPYGFVLLAEDFITKKDKDSDTSEELKPIKDTVAFFQKRDSVFKLIYPVEDSLLAARYNNDSLFWNNWYGKHFNLYQTDSSLYASSLSSFSDLSYLSKPLGLSYLLNLAGQGTLSTFALSSYMSYEMEGGRLYLWFRGDTNSISNKLLQPYEESFIRRYIMQKSLSQLDLLIDKYKFKKGIDTLAIERNYSTIYNHSGAILRPTLPYAVEDVVRSVKHARQYLNEKIYARHWSLILSYVFSLSLLFFFVPFLSIRHLFGLLAFCIVGAVVIAFKLPEKQPVITGQNISNATYLCVPFLSCLWMAVSAFKKQELKGFIVAVQGVFVGLLLVLVGALFVIYREKAGFRSIESFQPPYNLAFYGVQVLGILGAVLTTYVRTLPKQ